MVLPFTAAAQKVGGGDLSFNPKGASSVIFSHEVHVKSKGLKCTGCHYQVFQMTKGSYKMDMSKLTKGDFCGKCHNGQKSFDVKETGNCQKCHK
jgi:c(7)-type cytochrome triheme protein